MGNIMENQLQDKWDAYDDDPNFMDSNEECPKCGKPLGYLINKKIDICQSHLCTYSKKRYGRVF